MSDKIIKAVVTDETGQKIVNALLSNNAGQIETSNLINQQNKDLKENLNTLATKSNEQNTILTNINTNLIKSNNSYDTNYAECRELLINQNNILNDISQNITKIEKVTVETNEIFWVHMTCEKTISDAGTTTYPCTITNNVDFESIIEAFENNKRVLLNLSYTNEAGLLYNNIMPLSRVYERSLGNGAMQQFIIDFETSVGPDELMGRVTIFKNIRAGNTSYPGINFSKTGVLSSHIINRITINDTQHTTLDTILPVILDALNISYTIN